MELRGIDIKKGFTHSARSAASSKEKSVETSLKNIIKCAGRTSEKTFAQYYNKQIKEELDIRFE